LVLYWCGYYSFSNERFKEMIKQTMTKEQLKVRVVEEAKAMVKSWKSQGQNMTMGEAKKDAEKVFREEFIITK
jgi:hypothetical protein